MTGRPVLGAVALAFAALAAAAQAPLAAQSEAEGVWNLRSRDMTDRATGGIRVVLLKVEQEGGVLRGEMTSIANRFLPVDDIRYRDGTMRVTFGSYEYALRFHGDDVEGTVVSPLGTQELEGFRQYETLMYVGDEPEAFHTTRPGVLGHRTLMDPPADAADPHAWVTARAHSVEDLALIVGRRAKVAVPFVNPEDFADELMALAGREVTVLGTWEGDRLRIESVEAGVP